MSLLIQYLVKLSVSLAIVWLFYQFVLRRLTFYNSNRWYLLGYTLLSFFIPFINISPVLEKNEIAANGIVQFIPSVQQYTAVLEEASHCPVPIWSTNYDKWDWLAFAIMTGAGILLLRFIIRFVSFLKMQQRANLVSTDEMRLYQVNECIIPFSFGNSVFINSQLHSEAELQEIIRHEFVHVKQKHTIDIIWGELLCILNWYNPFAWVLRKSIRQNLEFIADNKALENGIDRKQYQYLLLKVIGNNHFSIAQKFNFSSLKKRIAMMNKLKTARIHLLRFLFMLPLLAVILISFRQKKQDAGQPPGNNSNSLLIADTIPSELNEKGYIIDVIIRNDNTMVVVKDKNRKVIERMAYSRWKQNEKLYEDKYKGKGYIIDVIEKKSDAMVMVKDKNNKVIERIAYNEWKQHEELYENKYGELPPPPPPPLPPDPPTPPQPIELPENVRKIDVNDKKATVVLKDGKVEKYDLDKPEQKAAFEKKYGEIIPAPPEFPVKVVSESKKEFLERNKDVIDIGWLFNNVRENKPIEIHIFRRDGVREKYNLDDPADKARAERKYGELPLPLSTPPHPPAKSSYEISATQELNRSRIAHDFEITDNKAYMRLKDGFVEEYNLADSKERKKFEEKYGMLIEVGPKGEGSLTPVTAINTEGTEAVIVPARVTNRVGTVTFMDDEGYFINGEEDILVTITKKTTQQQLEAFVKQMKEKGIELKFDDTDYKDGILTRISGTMKLRDGHCNFSATDFKKVILSYIKDGDHIYLKVRTNDEKQVI